MFTSCDVTVCHVKKMTCIDLLVTAKKYFFPAQNVIKISIFKPILATNDLNDNNVNKEILFVFQENNLCNIAIKSFILKFLL